MIDGCNGCKYENTPCIIRICGNAPRATAADIKTLEKSEYEVAAACQWKGKQ